MRYTTFQNTCWPCTMHARLAPGHALPEHLRLIGIVTSVFRGKFHSLSKAPLLTSTHSVDTLFLPYKKLNVARSQLLLSRSFAVRNDVPARLDPDPNPIGFFRFSSFTDTQCACTLYTSGAFFTFVIIVFHYGGRLQTIIFSSSSTGQDFCGACHSGGEGVFQAQSHLDFSMFHSRNFSLGRS